MQTMSNLNTVAQLAEGESLQCSTCIEARERGRQGVIKILEKYSLQVEEGRSLPFARVLICC